MSDSVQPHRRQPTRLPHPWDSPGKNTGVGCHFLLQCMKVKSESEVAQSCTTLSDPMDCSPPGSSVRGILQARVLEWGAIDKAGTASMQKPRGFECPWIKIRVRVRVRVKPSAKAHVRAGCGVCFSLNKFTSYLSVTLSLTEFFLQ